jgi:LPXTG-motif cell wall anchor domain protein
MAIYGSATSGSGNSVISLQEINTKRIQFKEGLESVIDAYKAILKDLEEYSAMKEGSDVGKQAEDLIAKINEILVGLEGICNKHYSYLLAVLSGREEMDSLQNAELFNTLQDVGLATGAGDGQNSTTVQGDGNNVQTAGRDINTNYYQRAGRDNNGHNGVGNTGHAGYGNSGNIAAQGNGIGNRVADSSNNAGSYNGGGHSGGSGSSGGGSNPGRQGGGSTTNVIVPQQTGTGTSSTSQTERYWKSTITQTTPNTTPQNPAFNPKLQVAGGASQSKINLVNNVPGSSGFSGGGGGGSSTYNTYNYPQQPSTSDVKPEVKPTSTPSQNAEVTGKGNASNVVGDGNVVGNNMNAQSLNGDAVNQAGLLNDNSRDFVGTVFGDFDDSKTSFGNNTLGQDFTKAGLGLLGLGGAGLAYGAYKYNKDKNNNEEDEAYLDNQMDNQM